MVRRRQVLFAVAHEVRHDHSDPAFLVIEHNWRAAFGADTQLQRTIGVFRVERLTLQAVGVVDRQVHVFEEDDMRGVLPGHAFTDGAMASVVVDRVIIGMGVTMFAPASIFV